MVISDECTTWPFQILILSFKIYPEIRMNSLLPSVIILPRFHVGFLPSVLPSVFCILQLSCLDSIFMFCLLYSAIILPRFRVGFLSFAFCNCLASIPCLFSGFWISVPGGHCNIFYVQIGRLYAEILIY